MLVAPVVREGGDQRAVYLPAGRWYRFPTDEAYDGGRAIETIELHAYDGGSERSELYEDDRESLAYRRGAFRLTEFRTRTSETAFELSIRTTGRYDGAARRFRASVHGLAAAPRVVMLDGTRTEFRFDPERDVLELELGPENREVRVVR